MLYVGIDVAKHKHDCCIIDSDGMIRINLLTTNLLRKAQTLRKTKTEKGDLKFIAYIFFADESKFYLLYHTKLRS